MPIVSEIVDLKDWDFFPQLQLLFFLYPGTDMIGYLGVNFSMSIPIYTGNGLSSQTEQRRIEWNQATEDYTSLTENLNIQALNLLEILSQYIDILPIQSQVVESAQEDLTLARDRYFLGATTILEVLDAQVSLNLARTTWVNIKYDFWISAASLKALTGELNTDFGME